MSTLGRAGRFDERGRETAASFLTGYLSSPILCFAGRGVRMPDEDDRLAERYRELRGVAARIARERYAPRAEAWDLGRTAFPKEERRFLGDQGLLGLSLPGGDGGARPPPVEAPGGGEGPGKGGPAGAVPGVRGH